MHTGGKWISSVLSTHSRGDMDRIYIRQMALAEDPIKSPTSPAFSYIFDDNCRTISQQMLSPSSNGLPDHARHLTKAARGTEASPLSHSTSPLSPNPDAQSYNAWTPWPLLFSSGSREATSRDRSYHRYQRECGFNYDVSAHHQGREATLSITVLDRTSSAGTLTGILPPHSLLNDALS